MTRFACVFLIFVVILSIGCPRDRGCARRRAINVARGDLRKDIDKTEKLPVDECLRLASSGNGKIPGWKLVSPANSYNKETLFDYIDGAAELYFAYDFRAVAAAEYQNGKTSIITDVYDMTSPKGAFGIYSLNRYQGAKYISIGNEGILSGAALDFWKGNYFCKVYSFDMSEKYQADVKNFGNALASEIKEAGSEPSIINNLPKSGLIPRSAKFFTRKLGLDNIHFISQENLLGLSGDPEGAVADYALENHKFQIFTIRYPSSNKANSAFKSYRDFLKESSSSEVNQENLNIFESDGKLTGIYLKDQDIWGFWDLDVKETAELSLHNFPYFHVPK